MNTKFFAVFGICTILCCIYCCGATETTVQPPDQRTSQMSNDQGDQLDQETIMMMCNETFRTSTEYLIELNTTGAFPDETDKTPMCYIRCYLENVGVMKDDKLDREKAIQMSWSTSEDALDECNKEVADLINPCEKAYFLTRCVMMRNIVDTRTNNEEK